MAEFIIFVNAGLTDFVPIAKADQGQRGNLGCDQKPEGKAEKRDFVQGFYEEMGKAGEEKPDNGGL